MAERIPEGARDVRLAQIAGALWRQGASAEALEVSLLAANAAQCDPPLDKKEVRRIAQRESLSACAVGERPRIGGRRGGGQAQARAAIAGECADRASARRGGGALARARRHCICHDRRRGGIRQHWPLRSRTFTQWLARRYYEQTTTDDKPGQAVSRGDLAAAVTTLQGIARFDGAAHEVRVRVAAHGGKVYLDLCDDGWRAVEIDADGWRIVGEPPARFARGRGMLPLPEPQRGGSLDGLRALLNVQASDDDSRLLVGWLVGTLCPRGPYPVLALFGEQGSAKSTMARLLRGLIDHSAVPLRAEPREVRDLMIAASHSWCVVLDNISHIPTWLSDALCRLSTGGFSTRELYSDDDEVLFDATRPVVLTAITEVIERGDLLDRTVLVRLPAIPEERRRTERELLDEYERLRPSVLGALCDAVSSALRERESVRRSLRKLPRLADWAVWAVAATRGLGWADDDLLDAFAGRRQEANALALEASPLGGLLVQLARATLGGLARHGG